MRLARRRLVLRRDDRLADDRPALGPPDRRQQRQRRPPRRRPAPTTAPAAPARRTRRPPSAPRTPGPPGVPGGFPARRGAAAATPGHPRPPRPPTAGRGPRSSTPSQLPRSPECQPGQRPEHRRQQVDRGAQAVVAGPVPLLAAHDDDRGASSARLRIHGGRMSFRWPGSRSGAMLTAAAGTITPSTAPAPSGPAGRGAARWRVLPLGGSSIAMMISSCWRPAPGRSLPDSPGPDTRGTGQGAQVRLYLLGASWPMDSPERIARIPGTWPAARSSANSSSRVGGVAVQRRRVRYGTGYGGYSRGRCRERSRCVSAAPKPSVTTGRHDTRTTTGHGARVACAAASRW